MKIAYKHLVRYIKENPSMEEVSNSLFQLGHEHELEGNIFNMELTPNRGDCLSINGLLRDLSAFYQVSFNPKSFSEKINKLEIDFENLSENICPQISFLKLEIDNHPHEYKSYLNDYFLDLNINKNNFFTDISNYISYEIGQPTHCYDANKINGKLIFQELDINQEFETLLDKKINLIGKNSVFFLDNKVINLAGVVGDKSTSCSPQTKSVLIECAFFKPESIIGKSVKYDIQSEASHKFERCVDPSCHDMVLRRFIYIVRDHVNIKDMSLVSYDFKQHTVIKIPIDVNKINQIIGTSISEDEYLDHLSNLGFVISNNLIHVPSYRSDIETQNDLAEEIARIIGYDNILKSDLVIPKGKILNNDDIVNKLRYFLLDNGFYEVINSPFVETYSDNSVEVDNPLDSNKKYLRTNISDSLLDNLIFNERRQKDSIKLFEVSDVYTSSNDQIKKTKKISIIASGRVGHNHEDFSKKINKDYLVKLFNEALPNEDFDFQLLSRNSLNLKNKNEIISCEIDVDNLSSEVLKYNEKFKLPTNFNQYSPISDQPFSVRDLSFSIKDFSKCKLLEEYILNYKDELLKDVYIFDYFHNQKNVEIKIGFRFIFQSAQSTITETEVNNIIGVIISHTQKIKGVIIPGLK